MTNRSAYQLELQISHSVCAKVQKENILRRKERRNRENIERTERMERSKHNRGRGLPRAHTYVGGNPPKNECIKFHGFSEREKQFDNTRTICKFEI